MTMRDKANLAISALLETLDESDNGSIPEGYAYVAIEQAGYPRPADVISLLVANGALTKEGNVLRITERGRMIANVCRNHRAALTS